MEIEQLFNTLESTVAGKKQTRPRVGEHDACFPGKEKKGGKKIKKEEVLTKENNKIGINKSLQNAKGAIIGPL